MAAPIDTGLVRFAVLLAVLVFTGAFLPLLLAISLSWLVAYLYQRFAVGRISAPSDGAVIITGCSSGIGHDAAVHLAKKGLKVFAGVRSALPFIF